jgi:ribA/ribD-fused uncharacterized protein
MKKSFVIFCFLCFSVLNVISQTVTLPADTQVLTSSSVVIKGKPVPYKATTGTQPVWDASGKVIASLFYTYYERTDIKDQTNRPLVISFNGGPGSASVWMHVAYTGPKVLNIDTEGYPVQPYGVQDNPYSILDVADIVFVDPVNTGYSRILDKEVKPSVFFGVNADIKYLAEWINTFVTRKNRWPSPKFLIGESYGTTRVSGLALELQNSQWMYLNGVVLVSPTDLGILRDGPVDAANRLPYFAATAWYHKLLKPEYQQKDLTDFLPEVEKYTIEELLPAMAMGGFLPENKKLEVAKKFSEYYYQAMKFPLDAAWQEEIRRAATPVKAKQLGGSPGHPARGDWEKIKEQVMKTALLAKFRQNPALLELLKGTGERRLVEASTADNFWGAGPKGKGLNRLGALLTEVRAELKVERPDKTMLAPVAESGSSSSDSSGSGSSGSGSSGSDSSESTEESPEALAKEGESVAADAEVAVKQIGGSGSGSGSGGNGVYLFINSTPMGGVEQKARQARGRGPARSLSWEGMESVSQSGGGSEQLTTETGQSTEVKVEKLGS